MSRTSFRSVRRVTAAVLAAAVLVGCSGAAGSSGESAPDGGEAASPGPEVTAEPISAAREITDAKGVTVTTEREPERIVCLVGLCDDMLTELGITPVATNNALLYHPDFLGEDADGVPQIPGGFIAPEIEAILSYRPDLVIGLEDTHGKLAPALEGATTFWPVQPATWEDSVGYLRNLAALTGRTEEGQAAEERFRTALAGAQEKPSDETALIIYGSDENFGVATPGTDVAAGLFPRIAGYPWESRGVEGSYSLEEILARDVDVLFVETLSFGDDDGQLSEKLAANPLWSQIPAVREDRVYEVDPEVWAKGRGTRSLGIVLDEATARLR